MIYLVGAIALLVLVYGLMGVKIVHQGFHYTIEHFGRYTTTATPGDPDNLPTPLS